MVLFFSGYNVLLGLVNTDGGVLRDKNGDFGVFLLLSMVNCAGFKPSTRLLNAVKGNLRYETAVSDSYLMS